MTAYHIARIIATEVCATMDDYDYRRVAPIARDAAYGVLAAADDGDYAARSAAAKDAAITARDNAAA
jgi:hypothetical protein